MQMNKFFLLLKVQLVSALNQGNKGVDKGKRKKAFSAAGIMLVYIFALAFVALYEYIFAGAFYTLTGNLNTFTTLLVFIASIFTLFSSISSIKSLIFCSLDYDMTLSLPVSAGTVVAAKTATVYIFDLITTGLILLPAYFMPIALHAPMPVSYWIMYPLLMLFVPMLPLMIGAVISALVSFISAHFKYMRVISMLIYIAFICGVFYLSLMSSNLDDSEIASALDSVTSSGFMRYYPFAGMFTAAILLDIGSLGIFLGASVASLLLVCFVFAKYYGELHDFFNKKQTGGKYKLSASTGNARSALFKKDISKIFSSGMIFVNICSGVIMMLVAALLLLFKLPSLEPEMLADVREIIGVMAPFFIGMMAGMCGSTTSSISLEGRCLPLLKSLPISYADIIKTKLRVHLKLMLPPTALASIIIGVGMKFDVVTFVFMLIIPFAFSYFTGVFGLLLNLKKYNLEWTNEMVPVKQGFPVFMTMICGMVAGMVGTFGGMLLVTMLAVPNVIVFSAFFALQLIACGIVTYLLKANGEKLFTAVGE